MDITQIQEHKVKRGNLDLVGSLDRWVSLDRQVHQGQVDQLGLLDNLVSHICLVI